MEGRGRCVVSVSGDRCIVGHKPQRDDGHVIENVAEHHGDVCRVQHQGWVALKVGTAKPCPSHLVPPTQPPGPPPPAALRLTSVRPALYPPNPSFAPQHQHPHPPAALRLSTARRVYSDAHTAATAAPRSCPLSTGTFITLSYSPAPLMPSKSSTLAEERQMRVVPAGNWPCTPLSTSPGTGRPPTSAWHGREGGREGGEVCCGVAR